MAKSLTEWKNNSIGQKIDLDNQSFDCVDVSKSWVQYVTGVPWQTSCGWGNAKDIYANWYTKYLDKIPKGNAPKLGDVVVMNGSVGGGYGHTGVVIGIDGGNIIIAQQNTFTQQAVYTGAFGWNRDYITGFLRPKVAFDDGTATAPNAGYQRTSTGVNYRKEPTRNGELIKLFPAGEVLDFKGFVKGETVDNNNIWFVGRYTGGYAWSGGFTDTSTHDLTDLTPAVNPVAGNQRQVGKDVLNYRKTAEVAPDNVIRTFNPGEILTFDGWTHGQSVDGYDIWFRGALTKGWIWGGGLLDKTTHDLPEIKPTVVIVPPTTPTPPSNLTAKMIDISSHNKVTDYNAVKNAVASVIAKAGHTGKSYSGIQPFNGDPTFPAHKANLGSKLVGAYWYAYCSLNPETEAKAFLEAVGEVPNTFSYWLDIEETDGMTKDYINEWCQDFIYIVEKATKRACGVYCNRNWYTNWIKPETLGSRPIWLAHYDIVEFSNPVANQVAHQYTSKGSVPGITGNVDMNVVIPSFYIPTTSTPPVTPPVVTPPVVVPPIVLPPSNSLLNWVESIIKKIADFLSSWKRS